MAQSHGPLAVDTLARIAGDETLSPDTRIRACAELLNRGYGKPVEHREEHREQVTRESSIKDLTDEELEAEMKKYGITIPREISLCQGMGN
ncbi:MAG: hypothetical protein LBK55_08460 [Azoarcus sp.]|nr:hypothetical protein [Azoarcus sp.]